MTEIVLHTTIHASPEICFDLARSVAIHLLSTKNTGEKVISGRKEGLFELNDTVTWEAWHFGLKQQLTVKITGFNAPLFFEDQMLKGAFKAMRHQHYFKPEQGTTVMKDIFTYEVPYGWPGILFNRLILKKYMIKLLVERNRIIKQEAEKLAKNFTATAPQ